MTIWLLGISVLKIVFEKVFKFVRHLYDWKFVKPASKFLTFKHYIPIQKKPLRLFVRA